MKTFAQLGNASSDSKHCNNSICSRVSVLFLASCPSAVLWRVVSIVVDAVKRLSFRFFTHVCEEVIKLIPPFTNSNSSASIVWKGFVSWIKASSPHCDPNIVNSGTGVSMGSSPLRDKLPLQAPAGSRNSSLKHTVKKHDFFSTVASAITHGVPSTRSNTERSVFRDNKSSKSLSDERYFGRHCIGSFIALFSSGRRAVTRARCDFTMSCPTVNA